MITVKNKKQDITENKKEEIKEEKAILPTATTEDPKDIVNTLDEMLQGNTDDTTSTLNLADLNILADDSLTEPKAQAYSTDLLDNIQKIDPTLTVEQITDLINYLKGATRPDFMENVLTQTNEKLTESLKLMTILQMMRLPALFDYLNALQKNILNPDTIASMTFEDISKVSVNIQKEISDILQLGLKVTTQLSATNSVPTKVEKLANALMGVSDATRQRIQEIIDMEG